MNTTQDQKLRDIVQQAASHSPFYRSLYARHGVDIKTFRGTEDMKLLPIVTTNDLIEHHEDFLADNCQPFRISSSSGTMEHPKTLYRTVNDFAKSSEVLCRLLNMAGLGKGDSLIIGQPFDLANLGYLTMEACTQLGVMAIPVGLSVTNERLIQLMLRYQPTAIFSSPSRINVITKMLQQEGIEKVPFVHTVLLAGEPVLPKQRQAIIDYWGCKPFDLYGSEETDGLGGTCEVHNGLHFMDDLYHLELIDPQSGQPNDIHGGAVVTSLYSQGTPLIRYQLGDLVERLPDPCSCGRPWPKIRVHGRLGDVINLFDGIKLYAYQVEQAIFSEDPDIKRYQITCRNLVPGMDEVCVAVEAPGCKAAPELERRLQHALWNCSLDLSAARDSGSLRIRVQVNQDSIVVTPRGKTPRVLDMRHDVPLEKTVEGGV